MQSARLFSTEPPTSKGKICPAKWTDLANPLKSLKRREDWEDGNALSRESDWVSGTPLVSLSLCCHILCVGSLINCNVSLWGEWLAVIVGWESNHVLDAVPTVAASLVVCPFVCASSLPTYQPVVQMLMSSHCLAAKGLSCGVSLHLLAKIISYTFGESTLNIWLFSHYIYLFWPPFPYISYVCFTLASSNYEVLWVSPSTRKSHMYDLKYLKAYQNS